MRAEASHLAADCKELNARYEALKLAQKQLAYEDTVDEDRNAGLEAMKALKAKQTAIEVQLGETELYSKTLVHMLRRSEEEKLSEMAALKAFEDSLAVHRAELDLADGVLRQVNKARDEEQQALAKLHTDLRKEMATLDKKLEARRQEVKVRQDKARWRMAKAAEEAALKNAAQGMLTEDQERAMIERAKNLTAEHDILRQEKMSAQAEADGLEAEFAAIRFAAGVRVDSALAAAAAAAAAADEPFAEPKPEPGPIVARFAQLEEEIHSIESTLAENMQLLALQQQQLSVLGVLKQPRARDAADEADRDVEVLEALQKRVEDAKRSTGGVTRDLETSRSLRLHLEQSLSDLGGRLRALPPVDAHHQATPAELAWERAAGELEASADALPTGWARDMARKTVAVARHMHQLRGAVNPNAAASGAVAAAAAWERSELGAAASAARPPEAATLFASERGTAPRAEGEGEEAEAEPTAEELAENAANAAREAATEKLLEATVESLIVSNEWSVRVRPGSSGPTRPSRNITGKALTDAVAAFERTWRDGAATEASAAKESEATRTAGAAAATTSSAAAASGGDPFGAQAAAQQRKILTDSLAGAYATVSATVGLTETPRPEDVRGRPPPPLSLPRPPFSSLRPSSLNPPPQTPPHPPLNARRSRPWACPRRWPRSPRRATSSASWRWRPPWWATTGRRARPRRAWGRWWRRGGRRPQTRCCRSASG